MLNDDSVGLWAVVDWDGSQGEPIALQVIFESLLDGWLLSEVSLIMAFEVRAL